METLNVGRSSEEAVAGPDPSWSGLYKAGGVSGVLVGILFIINIVLLFTTPQAPSSGGVAYLQYIASNRSVYVIEQVLGLAPVFLEIVALLALYMAIKNLNKSYAAIGSLLAIVSQAIVLAYITFGGLVYLSDNYMAATTDAQRTAYATAAEWAIAVNNAVSAAGIDPILTACAIGVLIISLVMLKGVFPKGIAYFGIVTGALGIISAFGIVVRPIAVPPPLGIGYIVYAFFLTIWFVAVGLKLYRLG
jgi:hypothetical protein